MIYLVREVADVIDIAICEDKARVEAFEAAGYRKVKYSQFRSAWRARDAKAVADRLSSKRPKERAVGEPSPYTPPPAGFTKLFNKKGF